MDRLNPTALSPSIQIRDAHSIELALSNQKILRETQDQRQMTQRQILNIQKLMRIAQEQMQIPQNPSRLKELAEEKMQLDKKMTELKQLASTLIMNQEVNCFLKHFINPKLNPIEAVFVGRYLSTLFHCEGSPWILNGAYNDVLEHANKAEEIAKNIEHNNILIPLANVLAYYPLQLNGLDNFVQDFKRLISEINLPREVREQPQRLAIALAIFQANYFKETPISQEELEEIRSMDLALLRQPDPTKITFPKFWYTHLDYCNTLFRTILNRDSRSHIAAQELRFQELQLQVSAKLCEAAQNGQLNTLSALLRIPTINVNGQIEPSKVTALSVACQTGQIEIVRLLQQDPRIEMNFPSWLEMTPFCVACYCGQTSLVQLLLKDPRVDINRPAVNGYTPLMVASHKGYVAIVKELLGDKRVDPTKTTNIGANPLIIAAEAERTEVVRILLEDNRIDVNHVLSDGRTALYVASEKGQIEIIRLLQQDPRIEMNPPPTKGKTPFDIACAKSHLDIVEILVNDPRVDVNRSGKFFLTPFFLACLYGIVPIVQLLLKHPRIEINKQDSDGATPFYRVCQKIAEQLYSNQLDGSATLPTSPEKRERYFTILTLLLQNQSVAIDQPTRTGISPFYTACECGDLQLMEQLLLDPRVDIKRAQLGITPLFIASFNGHLAIVERLLADGRIDPTIEVNSRSNPLIAAVRKGHFKIVQLLLKDGRIDINYKCKDGSSALSEARSCNRAKIEKLLLEDFRIDQRLAQLPNDQYAPSQSSKDALLPLRHMLLEIANPANKLQSEKGTTKADLSVYLPMCDMVPGGLRIRFTAQSFLAGITDGIMNQFQSQAITHSEYLTRIYIQDNGHIYTHELTIFRSHFPRLLSKFPRMGAIFNQATLHDKRLTEMKTVQHRLTTQEENIFKLDTNNAIAETLLASMPETCKQLVDFHYALDEKLSDEVFSNPLAFARARATRNPEQEIPFPWIEFDPCGMWIRLPQEMSLDTSLDIQTLLKEVFNLRPLPFHRIHPTLGKLYTMQYMVPRNDIPRTLNALGLGNSEHTINGLRLNIDYIADLARVEDSSSPRYYDYKPVLASTPYDTICQSLQKLIFHNSKITPRICTMGRNKNLYIQIGEIKTEEDKNFAIGLASYLGYSCNYNTDCTSCLIIVPAKQVEFFLRDKLRLDDPDGSLPILNKLWAAHPLTTFRPIIRHKAGKIHAGDTLAWSLATLMPEAAKKISGLDPDAKKPNDLILPTVKINGAFTEITIPEDLRVPGPNNPQPMLAYISELVSMPTKGDTLILDSANMLRLLEHHLGMVRLPLRYQNKQRTHFHHLYFDVRHPGSINEAGITITQPDVKMPETSSEYNQQKITEVLSGVLKNHPRADSWIGVFLYTHQMGEAGLVESAKKHVKECLSAILDKLQDSEIPDYKKTSLINEIGETCGPDLCEPGRASKLYSEYQKLVLPNRFDEVFSTLLSIIASYKESLINEIIGKDPKIPKTNTMHACNAFYKQFHRECGLNPDVSTVDEDTDYYGDFLIKPAHRDKFLKDYKEKRDDLVQWVLDGVNANRLNNPSKPTWTQSIVIADAIQEKFEQIFSSMEQSERTEAIAFLLSSKRQRLTALVAEKDLDKVLAACLKGDKGTLERALEVNQIHREQAPALAKELMPQVDAKGHDDLDACVLTKEGAIELLIALGILS